MEAKLSKSEKRALRKTQQHERNLIKRREANKTKRLATQAIRKEMLCAMTVEERREFILKERAAAELETAERARRLEAAKTDGKLHICIALEFMEHMTDAEQNSLVKQIQWFWNDVFRDSTYSVKLDLSSFTAAFEEVCRKFGFVSWQMNYHSTAYHETYPRESIIVLSPDATEILTEEEIKQPGTVFVVGGIVDKTVKKYLTKTSADGKGLASRRLPIQEMKRQIMPVLNINTVCDILCKVRFKDHTLPEAIEACTPVRKQDLSERTSRKERRILKTVQSSSGQTSEDSNDGGNSPSETERPRNPLL